MNLNTHANEREKSRGTARSAGRLTFRSQLLLSFVAWVLIVTAALSWLAVRTATDDLAEDAIRAVGIAANSRAQGLLLRLTLKKERAESFLMQARVACNVKGEVRAHCLHDLLENFIATEKAIGSRLAFDSGQTIVVGEDFDDFVNSALPRDQLAFFNSKAAATRSYWVQARDGDLEIALRFDATEISSYFMDRYGLGASGESFLADNKGFFITPPRYPTHSGLSHPIDAKPMQMCLSGKSGEIMARDYRGVDVIHGFRALKELGGACIMAHIDQAEAFAPIPRLRSKLLVLAAAFALVGGALAFFFRTGACPAATEIDPSRSGSQGRGLRKPSVPGWTGGSSRVRRHVRFDDSLSARIAGCSG